MATSKRSVYCSIQQEYFPSQVQEAHWIPGSGIMTRRKQDALYCTLDIIKVHGIHQFYSDKIVIQCITSKLMGLLIYWIKYFPSQVQEAHWIPGSGITTSSKQDALYSTEIKTIIQLLLLSLVVVGRDEVIWISNPIQSNPIQKLNTNYQCSPMVRYYL